MNKRTYFLACINVHCARLGPHEVAKTVVEVQAAAWEVPEEAIPTDVAHAAWEFFAWAYWRAQPKGFFHEAVTVHGLTEPAWLAAWSEARREERG